MTETMSAVELARLARRTLAEAHEVTLLIHGVGRIRPEDGGVDVVMRDVDGCPTFVCPPASQLINYLGRPAVVTIASHDPAAGTTLVLAGQLQLDRTGIDCAPGGGQTVVELRTMRVILEYQELLGRPMVQHEVPLALYTTAESEEFDRYARSIVEHTNECHQPQLREYSARRIGAPAGQVVDARLIRLDRAGAELQWIDVEGVHRAEIVFDPPARTCTALAFRLRAELESTAGPAASQ